MLIQCTRENNIFFTVENFHYHHTQKNSLFFQTEKKITVKIEICIYLLIKKNRADSVLGSFLSRRIFPFTFFVVVVASNRNVCCAHCVKTIDIWRLFNVCVCVCWHVYLSKHMQTSNSSRFIMVMHCIALHVCVCIIE